MVGYRMRTILQLLFLALFFVATLAGCRLPPRSGSSATEPSSSAERPSKVDVVIVGAGLSGLATAYELKKAGISYRILEREPRVGGRVRTGTYPDNSRAEVGLAEFWSGNPAVELAQELGVELEREDLSLSSLVIDGKLYPFTQNTNLEFLQAVLGNDYETYRRWDEETAEVIHRVEAGRPGPELMDLKDISFQEWLEQQPLTPFARKVVKAILEPEIGTSIAEIGALDGIAEWHLFSAPGAVPHHCVGGNQALTEALAEAVGRENIDLNTQVTNVVDGESGAEVRAVDTSSFRNRAIEARYVVLTVPLYRLFEIQFSPRLPDHVYQAVNTQGWGAYFTAHCLLRKEAEKFWTVEGENILPVLTGGKIGVVYPATSGDADTVMINLLVTGAAAENYNSRLRSFDDVQKIIESGMEESFPGITPYIERWTFYRYHPRAIASWPVGRSRFDDLSEGLRKPHGRLYFGGDFTETSHSDGAFISAHRVSRQIKEVVTGSTTSTENVSKP